MAEIPCEIKNERRGLSSRMEPPAPGFRIYFEPIGSAGRTKDAVMINDNEWLSRG
jgi:hypothetical protein